MLIPGLVFVGFGFFLRNFVGSAWLRGSSWFSNYEEASMAKAIGTGVTLFGGRLAIGGIVRMMVKR